MFWCRCSSRTNLKVSCPLWVLSSSHNNPSSLVLYNRAALFPCSTVALTLGQHPKIGNRPVCSGRVSLFQRNSLLKARPKTAVCFQWSCSTAIICLAVCSIFCTYVWRLISVCRGQCVCGPAGYCRSSSLFSVPDCRWEALILARPFIVSGLLLKAFY